MKRVLTVDAKAGMVVAGDVYTNAGNLVLVRGTQLDNNTIGKLRKYSVFDFFIKEDRDDYFLHEMMEKGDDKDLRENKNADYYEQLRKSEEFKRFENVFVKSLDNVKKSIDRAVSGSDDIDQECLINDIKSIMVDYKPDIRLFDMMHCIERFDDLTYVHSVNVALVCRVMGIWMRLSEEEIDVLTLCGLLHDVGKIMIPEEIIGKPGRLTPTEFALIKTHPIHGYNVLRNKKIDNRIKLAALEHHERCDGKGYPSNKKYSDIHDFSKIVAIADVYDAMTANRVYRKGICPFDVISTFEESMDSYDPRYLLSFLEKIAESYINTEVYLNEEFPAKIVLINKYKLGRPGVMVEGQFVDLSKTNAFKITSFR